MPGGGRNFSVMKDPVLHCEHVTGSGKLLSASWRQKETDAPAIAAAVVATELKLIMAGQSVHFNRFKCLQPSQNILKHDTLVIVAVFIIIAPAAASIDIIASVDRRIHNWRHANIAGQAAAYACICSTGSTGSIAKSNPRI